MIIEVKKTLYGAKIKEAMDLLRQFWREVAEVGQPKTGLLNDAWRALFKQHLPAVAEINNLPFHQEMIYHSLLVEAVLPLRVVIGYEGYVDEYGLREGFVGYLNEIAAQPPRCGLALISTRSLISLGLFVFCGWTHCQTSCAPICQSRT